MKWSVAENFKPEPAPEPLPSYASGSKRVGTNIEAGSATLLKSAKELPTYLVWTKKPLSYKKKSLTAM